MSRVRKPMFKIANTSTQICGLSHQRSLTFAMLSPELGGHRLKLDGLLQHGIVSVPLHEIGASHERPMFASSSVVVPQIEVHEINRLREGRSAEHAVLP